MVVERFGPVRCQVLAVPIGALTIVESHPFGSAQREFGGTGIERLAVDEFGFVAAVHRFGQRNCQDLWIGVSQATSVPACWSSPSDGGIGEVVSVGRSRSLPLWKVAPARTRATRCGALTDRQRAWAASISL